MGPLSTSVQEIAQNAKQWEAFSTSGHCVVLAPPGSGKTKLLATRVAYDLVTRIEMPAGAACITLTNPAAEQLQRRIDALEPSRRSTLFVGTVHSFALARIILPFARVAGREDVADLKIASRREALGILKQATERYYPDPRDQYQVRSTVERNRRRFASREAWSLSGSRVYAVYQDFETELRSRGLMDFDDIVLFAVELVENHSFVRTVLTARYPRIYVDEYQDLAPGLDRLVRALCFDHDVRPATLFAVGDPDQAILGFTGARPELLYDLATLEGVTPVHLELNYRCGSEIIRRSRRLLGDRVAEIVGHRSGGDVQAHEEDAGFDAQIEAAGELARVRRAGGTPLHEIAVLCSTNSQCRQVADALRARDLPSFVRTGEYETSPLTYLIESFAAWAVLGRESSGSRLGTLLSRLQDMLGQLWPHESSVRLVSFLLSQEGRGGASASGFMRGLADLGLRAALESAENVDEANAYDDMYATLLDGEMAGATVDDIAERARHINRIEVSTMTSSKGLEFDIVQILGADEGSMPDWRSRDGSEELQEDRRKFYVSLTRARDEVHIYYSGYRVTPYGRMIEDGPSRFLYELGLVEDD